jgi:hypothetical protein
MAIRKEDLYDIDFLDAPELESDGTSVYLSGELVSVISHVGVVVLNNTELTSCDNPVEAGDFVKITGTGGVIDGVYTVAEVLGVDSFRVNESILDWSGSGGIAFIYPSGASRVGYDSRGSYIISSNNVGGAIGQIDLILSNGSSGEYLGGGSPPVWVDDDLVRKLSHLDRGPWAISSYKEIVGGIFPESVIWYTDSSKSFKIVEKEYSYNSNKSVSSIVWKVYNYNNVVIRTMTEAMTYSGIFETSRVRTIS